MITRKRNLLQSGIRAFLTTQWSWPCMAIPHTHCLCGILNSRWIFNSVHQLDSSMELSLELTQPSQPLRPRLPMTFLIESVFLSLFSGSLVLASQAIYPFEQKCVHEYICVLRQYAHVFMSNQGTISPLKNRLRCYVKSPTAQDAFWAIPGLISCTGVTERWDCHLM